MNLRLHPTKGVNAHLTFCPRCGGEGKDLLMLGAYDKKFTCRPCGEMISYGSSHCLKCKGHDGKTEEIREGERLPSQDLCDACEKEHAEHVEIVKAGGVFFRCADCGAQGVVKPNEFSAAVREQAKTPPPALCGVEFTDKNCPQCGAKENA